MRQRSESELKKAHLESKIFCLIENNSIKGRKSPNKKSRHSLQIYMEGIFSFTDA